MKEVKRRSLNIFITLDQLAWSIITLGHAAPDETISAAMWRMEKEGKWQGKTFRPVIDFLFRPIEKDHCQLSYIAEMNGSQRNWINKQ